MTAPRQVSIVAPGLAAEQELSLTADAYNRYPGEQTRYFMRFTAPEQAGAVLQFAVPKILKLEDYYLPEDVPHSAPTLREEEQDLVFSLPMQPYFQAGQMYEISVLVSLSTYYFNQYLLAEARLVDEGGGLIASAETQVAVFGKGHYLKYLPEMYDSDDFMGRFLMLFESFWKTIAQQIDQMDSYFDPGLAPQSFVPWLASWIGMPIDPALPLERQRALVKCAMMLYQCRGTHQALKVYLEIFSSGEVLIIERRAKNFCLGEDASLGVETALGTSNQPNSISVRLRVPVFELERTGYTQDMYLQKMHELVRWMAPAHTVFEVACDFDPELSPTDFTRIAS
jgi:phage tail-like protein